MGLLATAARTYALEECVWAGGGGGRGELGSGGFDFWARIDELKKSQTHPNGIDCCRHFSRDFTFMRPVKVYVCANSESLKYWAQYVLLGIAFFLFLSFFGVTQQRNDKDM
jgi:hypothetical protein